MSLPDRARRRLGPVAAALLLPTLLLASVPTTAATAPSPNDPRPLVLEAGPQVGFHFGADGTVTARKRITLSAQVVESAIGRTAISGHGTQLLVSGGRLSGYYVRESIVAYVKGAIGSRRLDPPTEVLLPSGTVVSYRFDESWRMTDAVVRSATAGHRQPANRVAVINGQRYYRLVGGDRDGTWVPARGTGVARTLACATGPRAAVGSRQVVRRIDQAGDRLALTYDLGGRLDPALRIMRYLLLNGVCATVFPTGAAADTPTGRAVLGMVRQYPELFEVGNHTMNHCDLVRGGGAAACPTSRPTDGRVRRELLDAATIIEGLAGQSPVPYWRPPFGSYDSAVLAAAASVSYTKTILWDIDTIDWRAVPDGGPTADQIAAKILAAARDGSVVLNHLGGYQTRAALPAVIHGLRGTLGMEPTTISDLLARQ